MLIENETFDKLEKIIVRTNAVEDINRSFKWPRACLFALYCCLYKFSISSVLFFLLQFSYIYFLVSFIANERELLSINSLNLA